MNITILDHYDKPSGDSVELSVTDDCKQWFVTNYSADGQDIRWHMEFDNETSARKEFERFR